MNGINEEDINFSENSHNLFCLIYLALSITGRYCKITSWTRSSAVERFIHIEDVRGSNPLGSTVNILFFSRLFHPHIGGVEKHVLEVAKRLVAKGNKVVVITEELRTEDIPVYLQSKKKIPRHEIVNSIEIYRVPVGKDNWFKKFRIWKCLWDNKKLIEESDIIHCHDVFFWYLPFRFLFFKKPVYTTFHGYESYPLKSKFIVVHKISERLSRGNICIGDFIKKWYGTKPDYVTYGAVEISNFKFPRPTSPATFPCFASACLDEVAGGRAISNFTGPYSFLPAITFPPNKCAVNCNP